MPFPNISATIQSNNLLRGITVTDGRGALAVTVTTPSLSGSVTTVYSLQDAEQKGFTAAAEPSAYKHISEFYQELGGNMQLELIGYPPATTMKEFVNATNMDGLYKLLNQKDINLVGITRQPDSAYDPGVGFFDTDVSGAVLGSRPIAETFQKKNKPFRMLLEGRIANEDAENDFAAKDSNNNYIGVVLGSSRPDNGASVGIALARAVKYPAHIKLGAGTNGAVSLTQIYIGTQLISERLDMETLHDSGFITFYNPPGMAGYYFGVDNMASKDDLKILVHGRVIDKAQRVTAETLIPFLEAPIRLESDGSLNATDVAHLEDTIKAQIYNTMGNQVSNFEVVIPNGLNEAGKPVQDVINTSTLYIEEKIQPLGYMTWIKFTLGLTVTL
jgi:hypothetical protein